MPFLNRGELLQSVIDSCRRYTEAVLYVEGHNPFTLSVNGQSVTLFVANVSHAHRDDSDEYRIQCPGYLPAGLAVHRANGQSICVLGYHAHTDTFNAWDPVQFLQRSKRTQKFSMYTRLSNLSRASREGFASYRDSASQNVLSFRPEFLGIYLGNTESLHQTTQRTLRNIVRAHGQVSSGFVSRKSVAISKRKIQVTQSRFARNPQFRHAVLEAYGNRCAMCGIQLELIEAAHLVPHAHPNGLDIVSNGLALCALHHQSLDTGLIYLEADYSIRMNAVRRRYLMRMKRLGGVKQFGRFLRAIISLPQDPVDYPLPENIELGNQLRGIGVD